MGHRAALQWRCGQQDGIPFLYFEPYKTFLRKSGHAAATSYTWTGRSIG